VDTTTCSDVLGSCLSQAVTSLRGGFVADARDGIDHIRNAAFTRRRNAIADSARAS
jgi:hypothetical protein